MKGDELLDDDDKQSHGGLKFDLTINVSVLVFFVMQLVGFTWLFSALSTNVSVLMAAQPNTVASISTLNTDVSNLGIRTTALEARVSGDESTTSGLVSKRDSQIAALQAQNDNLAQTVAATSASLSAIQGSVDRILNLLQTTKSGR